MVTSQPSWAAATAVRSAASKSGRSETSWSAAKLPTMASGSRRAMSGGGQRDRRAGTPRRRFDQHVRSGRAGSWRATGAAWAGPQTTSVRSGGTLGCEAVDRLLQQRALAEERQQELGPGGAAERPQTRSRIRRPARRPTGHGYPGLPVARSSHAFRCSCRCLADANPPRDDGRCSIPR